MKIWKGETKSKGHACELVILMKMMNGWMYPIASGYTRINTPDYFNLLSSLMSSIVFHQLSMSKTT